MRVAAALAVFALGWAVPALAEQSSFTMADCNTNLAKDRIPLPGWHFVWENDSVIGPANTDEAYTQGLQFGYRFRPDRLPEFLGRPMAALCRGLATLSNPEHRKFVGTGSLFVGQHLFTPGNLHRPSLIADDRAYAAWLYVGTRLEVAQRYSGHFAISGLFHTFELQVGVTGTPANGQWTQRNWHQLIGAPLPQGWHNQLPTEVGVQSRYAVRALVYEHKFGQSNWQFQSTLGAETNLGTILVEGNTGGTVRFGRNLGDPIADPLSPTLLETLDMSATRSAVDENLRHAPNEGPPCVSGRGLFAIRECYLFVGATGHATGFNAFLDGTLFHGGHSVDKEVGTYDLMWGARLRWTRFQLEYTAVYRSREFSPSPATSQNRSGRHDYGAINLRCYAPLHPNDGRWDLACPGLFLALVGAVFAQ